MDTDVLVGYLITGKPPGQEKHAGQDHEDHGEDTGTDQQRCSVERFAGSGVVTAEAGDLFEPVPANNKGDRGQRDPAADQR